MAGAGSPSTPFAAAGTSVPGMFVPGMFVPGMFVIGMFVIELQHFRVVTQPPGQVMGRNL